MFRYALLKQGLQAIGTDAPTDEAQAVEHLGLSPKLVLGERNNLKVTFPEDLDMARMLLEARLLNTGRSA
jgi:2-C-methyl-D-erythritol 4-phosphate cytidylyltransferase